jgi:hypothetical protein
MLNESRRLYNILFYGIIAFAGLWIVFLLGKHIAISKNAQIDSLKCVSRDQDNFNAITTRENKNLKQDTTFLRYKLRKQNKIMLQNKK